MKKLLYKIGSNRVAQTVLSLTILIVAAQVASAQATNVLNSTGNAGVGTTSPESILTVQTTGGDSDGSKYLRVKNTNSFTGLLLDPNQSGDAKWLLMGGYPNVGDFTIREYGVGNYFTIKKTTGNVGIGTTSPVFDVNGSVSKYFAMDAGAGTLASFGVGSNITSASYPVGQVAFFNSGLGTTEKRLATIVGQTTNATNNGALAFWAASSGSFVAPTMFMTATNVGIGTTAPATYLHLKGNNIQNRGQLSLEATDYPQIFFWNGTTSGVSHWYHDNANNISYLGTVTNGGQLQLTSGADINAVRINSNGNVGIGTTNPQWGRLQVNKSIRIDDDSGSPTGSDTLASAPYLYLGTSTGGGTFQFNGGGGIDLWQFNAGWSRTVTFAKTGYVGIGTANPQYRLDVNGNTNVTGNITATGSIAAKYQDIAEWVPSTQQLAAGTVVVLDATKSNEVIASTQAYDARVAGVISAQPGITLGEKSDTKVLVATTGRVRVKVDATKSPIAIGDLLVTSDVAGVAMKSEAVNLGGVQIHRPGTIIGKALEPLAKGSGKILVLLSLQ